MKGFKISLWTCICMSYCLPFCKQKEESIAFKQIVQFNSAFNWCVQDFTSFHTEKFGRSNFILTVHWEEYSCEGLKLIFISHPMSQSTIRVCQFDQFFATDSTLILLYNGLNQIAQNNQDDECDKIISMFPKGLIKDDWDEDNHEPIGDAVFNSTIKGYKINGNSISIIEPKYYPSYYLPCIPCPSKGKNNKDIE